MFGVILVIDDINDMVPKYDTQESKEKNWNIQEFLITKIVLKPGC